MRITSVYSAKSASINKQLKQYEILTQTYDHRLASIQTVIIINTTFAAALVVALCTELHLFRNLFSNKTDENELMAIIILSGIATLQSLCATASIIHMAIVCNKLRKKLYSMERKLQIFTMHEKNQILFSIIVTIFCCSSISILFLICFIRTIILI